MLTVFLMTTAATLAQPDVCLLSRDALVGALDRDAQTVAKVVGESREARRLTETVRLKSGVEVSYTIEGCDELGVRYVFKNVPAKRGADAKAMTELTVRMLRETKTRPNAFDLRGVLGDAGENRLRAESSPVAAGDAVKLDCGAATCEYRWRAAKDGKVEIEARYALPM